MPKEPEASSSSAPINMSSFRKTDDFGYPQRGKKAFNLNRYKSMDSFFFVCALAREGVESVGMRTSLWTVGKEEGRENRT